MWELQSNSQKVHHKYRFLHTVSFFHKFDIVYHHKFSSVKDSKTKDGSTGFRMSLLEQRIFEVEFHSRKVQKFECTCQCFLKKNTHSQ